MAIQENYLGSPYIVRERRPGQSEMEYQMWNWYHFNWLSGDQTAQQLIHSIDKASWALGDKPPRKVWGMGGRQTALDPKFGDQFDHQAVVFEYDNGVRVFGFTRDQADCYSDTTDYIFGTKGRCNLLNYRIEGETNWRYEKPRQNMYDVEHAGAVRLHPRRQADQQRPLHVPEQRAGHRRADGLLHRRHSHLGGRDEIAALLRPAALRLGRRAAGEARSGRPLSHRHAGQQGKWSIGRSEA